MTRKKVGAGGTVEIVVCPPLFSLLSEFFAARRTKTEVALG